MTAQRERLLACVIICWVIVFGGCKNTGRTLPNSCTLERCSKQVYIIVKWEEEGTDILVAGSVQAYVAVGDIVLGRIPGPGPLRTIDEPIGYFILDTRSKHKHMGLEYMEMQNIARKEYGIENIPEMKQTFSLTKK